MLYLNALRKVALGSVCGIALTGAAHSADAVVDAPVVDMPVAEVPVISWTGGYIGLNAGYSWGDLDQTATIAPATFLGIATFDGFSGSYGSDLDGFSGGAQAGYNWQAGGFVFGLEADIQAANIDTTVSGTEELEVTVGPLTFPFETAVSTTTELEWFGTARLRAGFVPTERLLVYGTGGFAYGRTKSTSTILGSYLTPGDILDDSSSSSKTRTGWTAGAGAEYAIDANWSLKGEYLYTDLGDADVFNYNEDGIIVGLSNDINFHTVRIGVNYRF
ncbi:MAG: porin family protein [Mesorhizobium sp.]|nr:outer membrane protein [Mesorhizobium sp.]MBL8578869.1 porin family protein [Mesorhizobium sp.]